MPNKQKIKKMKNRIKEYEDLINDKDIWLKKFNQKILRLKQNLINEKDFYFKLKVSNN